MQVRCLSREGPPEEGMATLSSILPWRQIPGTGEPGGLESIRSHTVRHDWSDLAGTHVFGRIMVLSITDATVTSLVSRPPNRLGTDERKLFPWLGVCGSLSSGRSVTWSTVYVLPDSICHRQQPCCRGFHPEWDFTVCHPLIPAA